MSDLGESCQVEVSNKKTYSERVTAVVGILNPTIRTTALLNGDIGPLMLGPPTPTLIDLVHLQTAGYFA